MIDGRLRPVWLAGGWKSRTRFRPTWRTKAMNASSLFAPNGFHAVVEVLENVSRFNDSHVQPECPVLKIRRPKLPVRFRPKTAGQLCAACWPRRPALPFPESGHGGDDARGLNCARSGQRACITANARRTRSTPRGPLRACCSCRRSVTCPARKNQQQTGSLPLVPAASSCAGSRPSAHRSARK